MFNVVKIMEVIPSELKIKRLSHLKASQQLDYRLRGNDKILRGNDKILRGNDINYNFYRFREKSDEF